MMMKRVTRCRSRTRRFITGTASVSVIHSAAGVIANQETSASRENTSISRNDTDRKTRTATTQLHSRRTRTGSRRNRPAEATRRRSRGLKICAEMRNATSPRAKNSGVSFCPHASIEVSRQRITTQGSRLCFASVMCAGSSVPKRTILCCVEPFEMRGWRVPPAGGVSSVIRSALAGTSIRE